MGLDEFLISQDRPPTRGLQSLEDLDEALVSTPIGRETPGSADAPSLPAHASPAETASPAVDADRWSSGLRDSIDLPPELVAAAIISPPAFAGVEGEGSAAASSSGSTDEAASSQGFPRSWTATSPEASRGLGAFLATAVQIERASVPRDIDLFEGDTSSPAGLMENVRGPAASLANAPSAPPAWSSATSAHPVRSGFGWEGAGLTSPESTRSPATAPDAVSSGQEIERLEGRLALVAERLERAAERLASPSLPLGSRPRTFRGRIDG